MPVRVLFVEDESGLHEVLAAYLKMEGFEMVSAFDGAEAMKYIESNLSDFSAVILDVMLPEKSGIELLKTIRAKSDIPVIILTALGEEVDKLIGLELGADDYVVKPFSPRELVARLKAVLRRYGQAQKQEDKEVIKIGEFVFDRAAKKVSYRERQIPFTASELKIAFKLAENPKRVFTRGELVQTLTNEYVIDERIIDAHIKNIRKKLAEAGAPDFIETVRGFGYSLKEAFEE